VLARRAGKDSGSRFWLWTLRNALPWMAQRAGLRAGVAVATVVCAARKRVWRGARARCLFIS
ncbi:hypothetical protein A2U01_0064105, partial [Trifolium medium]|nr:hypothetical protein [Trifolium medium]